MSKFSSYSLVVLLALLLAACESTPKPELQPQPEAGIAANGVARAEAEASPSSDTAEAQEAAPGDTGAVTSPFVDPQAAAQPEPEPVDLDQLAYEAAIEELKNGSTESAVIELQRLTEVVPEKARLFTNLGLAHFRLQQPELAEQAFQQAVERDAEDAVAWNHLGILQRRAGRFQEALVSYQRAIEIDEKYARAQLNLGILFDLYLQDLEKALAQYRKYQSLTADENAQVSGWIVDIERRLKTNNTQTQG